MVCVWVAAKTVSPNCYTLAISVCFRGKGFIIKCYINSSVYFALDVSYMSYVLSIL